MKKLLLIFIVFALTLQSAWAAVAVYCHHHNEVNTKHLGHHEHQHEQAKQGDGDNKSPLTVDGDCVTCHGGVIGMMFMFSGVAIEATAISGRPFEVGPAPASLSYRPEKPNWLRAA
jgi:hypothetical protein